MNIEVNIIAVLVAAIASMAVGFAWYSPMLFASRWMKLMGYTAKSIKADQKAMSKTYAISFVVALVTAFVLSHVMTLSINFFHYDRISTGLISAFWMWIGFIAPVQLTEVLFGKKKFELFALNTGYQLAALLAMGLVLAVL